MPKNTLNSIISSLNLLLLKPKRKRTLKRKIIKKGGAVPLHREGRANIRYIVSHHGDYHTYTLFFL